MMTMRWLTSARRAVIRGKLAPRLAMIGIALVGLGVEGCKSGGCDGCGPGGGIGQSVTGFTQKIGQGFSNLGNKVMHHKKRGYVGDAGCCDGGAVGVVPIEEGIPTTVIPGPMIQGPIDSAPTELTPIAPGTSTKSAAPGSSQRSTPANVNSKMSYETERPVNDGSRSRVGRSNMARSLISENDQAKGADASDPLDNLPPVDLPRDVTRKASSAPVPVEAEALIPPASVQSGTKEDKPATPPANVTPSVSAAEPPSASLSLPPIRAALETSVSPGIKRFTGVEPTLAGGSAPTMEGLDWLKDKGYKTFLDLRERSEIEPAFVDEVINRGLRYVALPIGLTRLDENRVRRFKDEIAGSDTRPLYFCDTDGTRSAMLWYIHRVTDQKVESSMARREAEEIAPIPTPAWEIAAKYVASRPVTSMAHTDQQKGVQAPLAIDLDPSAKFSFTASGLPVSETSLGRMLSPLRPSPALTAPASGASQGRSAQKSTVDRPASGG